MFPTRFRKHGVVSIQSAQQGAGEELNTSVSIPISAGDASSGGHAADGEIASSLANLSKRRMRAMMVTVFGKAVAAIYLAQMNSNLVVREEVLRVLARHAGTA